MYAVVAEAPHKTINCAISVQCFLGPLPEFFTNPKPQTPNPKP